MITDRIPYDPADTGETPMPMQQESGTVIRDTPHPLESTMVQPKITGYRQLNEKEAALMNLIKSHGESLRILLDDIVREGNPDPRWVAIARTDFQTGLMALTRAVAKPTSF